MRGCPECHWEPERGWCYCARHATAASRDRALIEAGGPFTPKAVCRHCDTVAGLLNYLCWLAAEHPYRPITAGAVAMLIDGFGREERDPAVVVALAGLAPGFTEWWGPETEKPA